MDVSNVCSKFYWLFLKMSIDVKEIFQNLLLFNNEFLVYRLVR